MNPKCHDCQLLHLDSCCSASATHAQVAARSHPNTNLTQNAAVSSHHTKQCSFSSDPLAAFCLLICNRRLIVNEGRNNIGVLRHSVPPHSCSGLSAQIQSCRRPLAQPSATMSGRLGRAPPCTLAQGSSMLALQVCAESGHC